MPETSLYLPVKRFLEELGFSVKGEVVGCDVVALSDNDPPVVVVCEMKMQFNLDLVLQGVDRMAACDEVWLAAAMSTSSRGRERDPRFRALCRRLGLGLIGVLGDRVEVLLRPDASVPRSDRRRRSRLVQEHQRRRGDPSMGGSTRQPVMTAYRQEALVCATAMADGRKRPRDLKLAAPNAPKILRHNVYGWFSRVDRGIYELTAAGRDALQRWSAT